ncbi:MAG: thioredoxin family protein [Anaerolineales bacterium]|nr:thioredoxin family protein [Anaerolineales bacterium]
MQKLLSEDVVSQVNQVFEDLEGNVEVLFFQKIDGCSYCDTTRQLLEEVSGISEKLSLTVYDLDENKDVAEKYNVDKAPGIVLLKKEDNESVDYGVRFSGAPTGHEFTTLIYDLINVSKGKTELSDDTKDYLKNLTEPVHMMVFVTPTCPYCPQAVILAHQMAMESDLVTAEMIEATEFPELSNQFQVSGVPQTTINAGAGTVVGAAPENQMVAEIQQALAM